MSFLFKRLMWIVFFLLVIIIVLLTSLTLLYKQEVAKAVQKVLEEHLSSDFTIDNIRFNYYTQPGQLTLILEGLKIYDNSSEPLATIAQTQLTCELPAILQGKYTIKQVYVSDVKLNLKVNPDGKSNYEDILIFKGKAQSQKLNFNLAQVSLEKISYNFENHLTQTSYQAFSPRLVLQLNKLSSPIHLDLNTEIQDFKLKYKDKLIYREPKSKFIAAISFDPQTSRASFDNAKLSIKKSSFLLNGAYQFLKDNDKINIQFSSENKDLSPLIALLPQSYYDKLSNFGTRGNIRFNGQINGSWSSQKYPKINISFGANDIEIISGHNIRQSMQHVSFEGEFNNGDQRDWTSSNLKINGIQGSLAERKFRADIHLKNLFQPFLSAKLEAGIDLTALHKFYPIDQVEEIQGILGLDLNYKGGLDTTRYTSDSTEIQGNIEFIDIQLQTLGSPIHLQNLNARLSMTNEEVLLKSLEGQAGETDFNITGKVSNFLNYLTSAKAPLKLEGNFTSKNLRFEDILSPPSKTAGDPDFNLTPYFLQLPQKVDFELTCKIQNFAFRKFKANTVRGEIRLKDRILKTNNLQANFANGNMRLVGILNGSRPDFMNFDGRLKLNNTDVSQVFDQFENFSQPFVHSKHLQGSLNADIKYALVLNRNLWIQFPHLVADVHANINQGVWNGMGLFQKLNQTLNSNLFEKLNFEGLKSIIQIRNKNIYFPELNISSPKVNFSLIGQTKPLENVNYKIRMSTGTFNQAEEFPFIEGENGQPEYYLSVEGKPELYDIYFKTPEENPHLEWQKEKADYLKLFNENSIPNESFQTDSLQITVNQKTKILTSKPG